MNGQSMDSRAVHLFFFAKGKASKGRTDDLAAMSYRISL